MLRKSGRFISVFKRVHSLKDLTVRFWLHHTVQVHMLVHGFCISRKGGTGGGWGHPQCDMHMVAAKPGFERGMVGTGWTTSRPDCMDRLRKHYFRLVEGWFLARKAAWALSGSMTTNSADYYMVISEWAWLRSQVRLSRLENAGSGHGFSFGVGAWTETEI